MSRSSSLVTVGPERLPLHCLVCRGQLFKDRQIKLNTMEWLARYGTALICDRCSFVHTFAGGGGRAVGSRQGLPVLNRHRSG
jgi:hypothetical protein